MCKRHMGGLTPSSMAISSVPNWKLLVFHYKYGIRGHGADNV